MARIRKSAWGISSFASPDLGFEKTLSGFLPRLEDFLFFAVGIVSAN
jgi:hypothetical protein